MRLIPETIWTQVDNLIEIVKTKKEISFDDAATQLKLPLGTVESWATFLEEEGIVSIKYKFTTPYLMYNPKYNQWTLDEYEPMLLTEKLSKLIMQVQGHIKKGEFSKAKEKQAEIREKMNSLPSTFVSGHQKLINDMKELEQRLEKLIESDKAGIPADEASGEANELEFQKKVGEIERLTSQTKRVLSGEKEFAEIEMSDINELLEQNDRLINRIEELLKKGDFRSILIIFPKIITHSSRLTDRIREECKIEKPIDHGLNSDFLRLREIMNSSKTDYKRADIDSLKSKSNEFYEIGKNMNLILKTIYDEKEILEKRSLVMGESVDLEPLFNKAYSYIKAGRFDLAKSIYSQIESRYVNLPGEYLDKRNILKKDLVKLNRDMAVNLNEYSSKQMNRKSKELNKLIGETNRLLKRRELVAASKSYEKIQSVYHDLPNGYLDLKTDLQKRILDLQDEIIQTRRRIFQEDFNVKSNKILVSLKDVAELTKLNRLDESIKIYQSIRELFALLPEGFLQEKNNLQVKIMEVHNRLLAIKTRNSYNDMTNKAIQIEQLLSKVDEFTKANNLIAANQIYEQIEEIYKNLPAGFIQKKTELQNKILERSKEIAAKLDSTTLVEFNKKFEKIGAQIKIVKEHIKKRNYDLAHAEYDEIVIQYNSLPSGFIDRKTRIRADILNLYRNIMLGADEIMIEGLDDQTRKRYDDLLKVLIKLHGHIEKQEFPLMEAVFAALAEIYNELPIGFMKQKPKIIEAVDNMRRKIELFKLVGTLEIASENRDFDILKSKLESVYNIYTNLMEKSSEDIELFNYIYERYFAYLMIYEEEQQIERKEQTVEKSKSVVNSLRQRLITSRNDFSKLHFDYVQPVKA